MQRTIQPTMRRAGRRAIGAAFLVGLLGLGFAHPALAGGEDQFLGTLMGAGLGGLIGNQFGHGSGRVATTTAGVLVGGLIGNNIGATMDRSYYYSRPAVYATPYYYAASPAYYQTTYVPNYVAPPAPPPSTMAYYDNNAETYCREYTQTIRVEGQVQESYGTACLQPDGTWHIVQ